MKAGLRFLVVALAFFGALSQSSAAATTKSKFKVETSVSVCDQKDDASLCLVEPQDSPEAVILANETTAGASMLSQNELSGGALSIENEALLALAFDPRDMDLKGTGALAKAERAQDQLRSVELYLKTVSPKGDITVITAGQH